MQKTTKKLIGMAILCLCVSFAYSYGSPIKNWTSNEYVTYTDLNNNFNHLHANLGHGHGPIITSDDIAPNAGIRPEQTTFANQQRIVANGVWRINPDGGAFIPVNYSGTLPITVGRTTTGVRVQGAAQTGYNADGGTEVYNMTYTPFDLYIGCFARSFNYTSPFDVYIDCYNSPASSTVDKIPAAIGIQVYTNKVF